MAKQAINIGTTANDGTGDPIRDAFDKVNDNEDELYEGANITATSPLTKTSVADTSVTLSIADDGITATQLAVDGNGSSGQVLTSQSDGTFTWATGIAGDVDSVNAGSGISVNATTGNVTVTNTAQNATHTGDVTGSGALTIADDAVVTAKILDANVTLAKIADAAANTIIVRDANSSGVLSAKAGATSELLIGNGTGFTAASLSGDVSMDNAGAVTIANDAVEHSMLENRYTAKATSTGTGDQNLNASTATSFLLTGNVATATLTIQNMKLGQVIDIQLTGTLSSAAITLATDFSSTTFYKVGSTDFDTAEKNVIQVVCIDDTDAAAIVNYSVGKLTADTTP